MHVLNLILSQYPGGEPFYEFDISNQPLSTTLQVDLKQLTGIFTSEGSDSGYFVAQLAKFLGKLPTERILLYVCSDCGDIGDAPIETAANFVNTLSDDFGFKTDVTHFAIYGLCAKCADIADKRK